MVILVGMISVGNGLGWVNVGSFLDRCGQKRSMLLVASGFFLYPFLLMVFLLTKEHRTADRRLRIDGAFLGWRTHAVRHIHPFGFRGARLTHQFFAYEPHQPAFGLRRQYAAGALYNYSHTFLTFFSLILLCAVAALLCMLRMERTRFFFQNAGTRYKSHEIR